MGHPAVVKSPAMIGEDAAMDSVRTTDERGPTPRFGQAVSHVGGDSIVRVWGCLDSMRASLLSECVEDLVATGQRSITLDVSALEFADFTAVAILVGALARIRQQGAETAVSPQGSGASRILERADRPVGRRLS